MLDPMHHEGTMSLCSMACMHQAVPGNECNCPTWPAASCVAPWLHYDLNGLSAAMQVQCVHAQQRHSLHMAAAMTTECICVPAFECTI